MSKRLVFQGTTEINVETSWVCGCKKSISRAEHVPGSTSLLNTQTAWVTLYFGARCALRGVSALPEVILICKEVLRQVSLQGVKLDCAIKIKLLIPSPQVITL